jgi:hypothetical protein
LTSELRFNVPLFVAGRWTLAARRQGSVAVGQGLRCTIDSLRKLVEGMLPIRFLTPGLGINLDHEPSVVAIDHCGNAHYAVVRVGEFDDR